MLGGVMVGFGSKEKNLTTEGTGKIELGPKGRVFSGGGWQVFAGLRSLTTVRGWLGLDGVFGLGWCRDCWVR